MTLPNKITFARIAILPFILYLYYSTNITVFVVGYILGWVFGLTDFLDGYLARKLGQVSVLGKILDPIADKVFVLLICLFFVDKKLLPAWALIILILREVAISDFRIFAMQQGKEVAVSWTGKWKALLQYILIAYFGLIQMILIKNPGTQLADYPVWHAIGLVIMIATLTLTLLSLFEYFWSNRALLGRS